MDQIFRVKVMYLKFKKKSGSTVDVSLLPIIIQSVRLSAWKLCERLKNVMDG